MSSINAMTTEEAPKGQVILEGRGLSKYYGPVVAVKSVDLEITRGEILAIVGDNGAGKSTLIKMLTGAICPDEGDIILDGKVANFASPGDARMHGIETVWQDLALVDDLDVAGNIYLGREPVNGRRWLPPFLRSMSRHAMSRGAEERLRALEITIPGGTRMPVKRLSGGERQAVAVARGAAWATGVFVMDEPTAALGVQQSKAVLTLARHVAERGLGVVMVSHTLPHVMEFADRIVVLRHGRKVADLPRDKTTAERLVALIVGFERGITSDEDDNLEASRS